MNIRRTVTCPVICCFASAIVSCATTAKAPARKSIIKDYDIKGPVAELIRGGKLTEAGAQIDKLLEANPEDVDAMFLKGILILKERENEAATVLEIRKESVFEPEKAYLNDPDITNVVSDEVAREVSDLWRRCTLIDKNRKEIHIALCGIFTDSQNDRELKNQIRAIKSIFPEEKPAYTLAEYAKKFYYRGQYIASMSIYNTIAGLYPEEAGLYSDMAALSFMYGNLPEAARYIDIIFRKGDPDYITAYNYFLINMAVGNYPNAVTGLKALPDSSLWKFYEGLNMYYRNLPDWVNMLNEYLSGANGGKEAEEIAIAKFLISEENKNDYESYLKSLKGDKWVSHIILARRAMGLFPAEYAPVFYYAKIMSYYKNYYEAYSSFRKIEAKTAELDYAKQSSFSLYYGWTLQELKKSGPANAEWQKLLLDGNLYKRSAGCYFYGHSLLSYGRKDEALDVFRKVSGSAGDSKFALFCRDLIMANTPQPAPAVK